MVLVGSGAVNHEELVKLAERYFGNIKSGSRESKIIKPTFVGSEVRARYDNHPTAHMALAVEGVSWDSPDYWPLLVAQSITGSWDRTTGSAAHSASKLAQEISKHNLANSFMSFNTSYSDTGLFGTYLVSENLEHLDDLMHFVLQEWHRLSINVTPAQVFRAKNQLKSALLLTLDGSTPIAEEIGRHVLVYGRRLSPWEIDGLIESVTPEQVMQAAKTFIYDREVAVVGYGPVEGMQDYNRVRSAMAPIYY